MSGECDQCGNTLCVCHMSIAELVDKEEYDALQKKYMELRTELVKANAKLKAKEINGTLRGYDGMADELDQIKTELSLVKQDRDEALKQVVDLKEQLECYILSNSNENSYEKK